MTYMFRYAGYERGRRSSSPDKPKRKREPSARNKPIAPMPADLSGLDIPLMPPGMKQTLFRICRKYNIHPNDITGPSRRGRINLARQEYCYVCKVVLQKSFSQIGRSIRRDHSTVIHSYKIVAEKIAAGSFSLEVDVDCGEAAADGSGITVGSNDCAILDLPA